MLLDRAESPIFCIGTLVSRTFAGVLFCMDDLGRVKPAIEEKLDSLGLELYGLRYFRAGSRFILRVFVDRPGGVKVSECEQASRDLSVLLDVEEFAKDKRYTLEVSSPGTDWPLREERDFRRVIGREVTLRFVTPVENSLSYSGQVISSEDGTVTLRKNGSTIQVALGTIASGKIELKFK